MIPIQDRPTEKTRNTFSRCTKIVTHPGMAHLDDLLSVATVLVDAPEVSIERRESQAEDINDPLIIVIDTGARHEPDKHNFDHHQFSQSEPAQCSLSLLLEYSGHLESARDAWPWLTVLENRDVNGPSAVARDLGIPLPVMESLQSPIESFVLRHFAGASRIEPGQALHAWLIELGDYLRKSLVRWHERWQAMGACPVYNINGVAVLDLRPLGRLTEPLLCVSAFCRRNHPQVGVAVTLDDRGPGVALWRIHDHPKIDFRKLRTHLGVTFVHANGFVAKVSDMETDFRAMIASSLVG